MKYLLLILLLAAFFSHAQASDQAQANNNQAQTGDLSVHRFHEAGEGSVNTWIIEGADGLVLIDAQRTKSAGDALAKKVMALQKPLRAILVTHPHPDHIGGLPRVLAAFPKTPVYSSQGAKQEMLSDSLGVFAFAKRVNGDAFPESLAPITHITKNGDRLAFGDIRIEVRELGAGESIDMTVFLLESNNAIFVGDILDNNMVGYLLEQRTGKWIAQINLLVNAHSPSLTAFPGHGASAPLQTLASLQKKWFGDLYSLIKQALSEGELNDAKIDKIATAFAQKHPNQLVVAPIPDLMKLNIKAVADEITREKQSAH
jgi:glyoxylase-like metal-dependent hydrolase (beta-lactamase superfamily II)